MGDLVIWSSRNIDYTYETEDPGCSILTMQYIVSPVVTNASAYTHNLIKNLLFCVDTDIVNPDMCFLQKRRILMIIGTG